MLVVSGALHSAVVAGDWPVEKVLRGQYKLLKDAPARQAEYMRLSSTGLYPEYRGTWQGRERRRKDMLV